MESLKRTFKFINIESKRSIITFWLVMILLNVISYMLNLKQFFNIAGNNFSFGIHMSDGQNFGVTSIAGANVIPILIFYIVYSYLLYYEDLPIAIGFSSTRKNFFISLLFSNIIVAFIFSLVQTILLKIDFKLIENLGRKPYVDFIVFNTQDDNIIFISLSIFLISFIFIGFMNIMASANYKFGYKMWIVLAIVFLIIMPRFGFEISDFIYNLFTKRLNLQQLLVLLVFSIISYGLTYLFIKDVNIKSKLA